MLKILSLYFNTCYTRVVLCVAIWYLEKAVEQGHDGRIDAPAFARNLNQLPTQLHTTDM